MNNYYDLFSIIGIFLLLIILSLPGFCLNYVYFKQHVFVEKCIDTLLTQKCNASRFICVGKKKHVRKECRFRFGVYYFLNHPYRVSSFFKFENSQDTQYLLNTIAQALELRKFVVESEPHHHNSLLLKRGRCLVRVSLHPLLNTKNFHTEYRLICTWIPA
jgi:hypothetical protein